MGSMRRLTARPRRSELRRLTAAVQADVQHKVREGVVRDADGPSDGRSCSLCLCVRGQVPLLDFLADAGAHRGESSPRSAVLVQPLALRHHKAPEQPDAGV